jgi:hypothetical protein
MDKLSISKFFSFIAEVVVTGDLPLNWDKFTNFHTNLKLLQQGSQGHRRKLVCEKKPEAENLVSDSL